MVTSERWKSRSQNPTSGHFHRLPAGDRFWATLRSGQQEGTVYPRKSNTTLKRAKLDLHNALDTQQNVAAFMWAKNDIRYGRRLLTAWQTKGRMMNAPLQHP